MYGVASSVGVGDCSEEGRKRQAVASGVAPAFGRTAENVAPDIPTGCEFLLDIGATDPSQMSSFPRNLRFLRREMRNEDKANRQ